MSNPNPNLGSFESNSGNKVHRHRLQMMQQERIVDPNKKVRRYHFRAIFTPMLMRYWVPLMLTMGAALAVSNNLTMKATDRKVKELESRGYGKGASGMRMTMTDRNALMEEHMNRVIKGEDSWEVAKELQQRWRDQQSLTRGRTDINTDTMPNTNPNASTLKRD